MLVCNVSLRPPRAGIVADIVEAIEATDATASGQAVFATLVDDPASVGDAVDAFLGEIMLEAASATDAITAGSGYAGAIDEALAATDTLDATSVVLPAFATLDGVAANATVTNGGLTVTKLNTADGGARSTAFKSPGAGKFYFEVTVGITRGFTDCVALALAGTTYSNLVSGSGGYILYFSNGQIYLNSGGAGSIGTTVTGGDIVCVAFDADTSNIWYRKNNGNWNGSGTANPATGAGGIDPGVAPAVAPMLGQANAGSTAGDNMTANFGATAFTYAVPSGFTAGWTA